MVKAVNVSLDYFRRTSAVSLRRLYQFAPGKMLATSALAFLAASAAAQYVGTIKKPASKTPQLRAVAVLEWTGDAGKPKSSRLVPVAIFDGERLNDAGIYMARPQPIAVAGEVEYELKKAGKTVGLFDIKNAGQEQGAWVGYGEWKPLQSAKTDKPQFVEDAGTDDDKPVLHRKKHTDDAGTAASDASATTSAKTAPADDPDRPRLHKNDGSQTSSASDSAAKGPADSGEAPDADQPTLRRHSDTAQAGNDDHGKKHKKQEDVARVDSIAGSSDPDRPRLQRGKTTAENLRVTPSLMGLPADMKQTVAVSDTQTQPEHPWSFSWPSPDDEAKYKAQLEDAARAALGMNQPPAPAPKPQSRPALRRGKRPGTVAPKPAAPAEPVETAELHDEQFRVFELAYGAGATMVLTANSGGALAQQKFVTLIAQPDLYGNVNVLFKNVTDGTHLDDNPQMRIIDAVDAQADNRGDLLFELRGKTQRTFALYRVARGRAERLFTGGGGEYGSMTD